MVVLLYSYLANIFYERYHCFTQQPTCLSRARGNLPVFVAMHTGVVWLTIIPRVQVGSEMVDSQRGA